MSGGGKWFTIVLLVLLALLSSCSARYLSSSEDAEAEGDVKDTGFADEEDLPLEQTSDELLSRFEPGLPFYVPADVFEGKACGVLSVLFFYDSVLSFFSLPPAPIPGKDM